MDHVQQLRNLKDFLLVYNRMTEICFQRCTTNFNYRALTMDEGHCVDSCAGKLIRSNHRLMGTYVQLMPQMVQKRMEELESKAAEVAQASSAGVAVAAVPGEAAADVPVASVAVAPADVAFFTPPDVASVIPPDAGAAITVPGAPLPVSDVPGAVPDLSGTSSPAADIPVANGPSSNDIAGSGSPVFVSPPALAPELSGLVGLVPGVTETLSSEAKVVVPIATEGPSTPVSLPSVTELALQGSSLSISGEKKGLSPLELPSTAPAGLSSPARPPESSILVPDLVKASSDVTVPVSKPADMNNGINAISNPSPQGTSGTGADSQSSS